ncbi:hypothetical protein mRhiFer1_009069 [Rhinolophus ferrumequinum]|uniref:Secreted protein n=1 Tax=Rhinolophus ferrumequinum TaxID=59479 RepID=A0A7J7SXK6_RHIFE|nr:hypothetical protein mRhiFer1_009069 [Rhinolophus ferrumequinum]
MGLRACVCVCVCVWRVYIRGGECVGCRFVLPSVHLAAPPPPSASPSSSQLCQARPPGRVLREAPCCGEKAGFSCWWLTDLPSLGLPATGKEGPRRGKAPHPNLFSSQLLAVPTSHTLSVLRKVRVS